MHSALTYLNIHIGPILQEDLDCWEGVIVDGQMQRSFTVVSLAVDLQDRQ